MRMALQLKLIAVRIPGPSTPVYVHIVVRPRRAMVMTVVVVVVANSTRRLLQPVEGAVAVGGFEQGVGAVARGG